MQSYLLKVKFLFPILIILFLKQTISFAQHENFGKDRGKISKHAMVVTAHPNASKIGIEILKKGGNVFDASIAVQFALAVSFPAAGNIGGGGFMVYRTRDTKIGTLDYREKGSMLAYEKMFQDSLGNIIPSLSTNSGLASGVPGTVDGMCEIHKKFGSLPWKDLIQPAIDLALKGVIVTEKEANAFNSARKDFIKYNKNFTPQFVKDNEWKKGDTIKHIDLGHTLERIRDNGRDGFYSGETAEKIISSMKINNGLISFEDLKNYKSIWREPIIGKYKEYQIIGIPPPSSGGIALLSLLKMTEGFNLKKYGWQSSKSIHLITEAEKRVYADRSQYLGDPDFIKIPVKTLIDEKYIIERAKTIDTIKATPSSEIRNGAISGYESMETTHFSIADDKGNAVSITTTLNDWFGSKIIVEGAGFILNNEMDDFSSKPGEPNIFGMIGGKANAISPGKRMLSSMTPTIIIKNNKLFMVVGTPGGSTIITSVFQTILNVIEYGMTMKEAVSVPRFHSQWLPDNIQPEKNAFSNQTIVELERMGHKIEPRKPYGRVDGILFLKNKKMEGGADPRGDDTADGY